MAPLSEDMGWELLNLRAIVLPGYARVNSEKRSNDRYQLMLDIQ
jgi:hypothetical protein